MEMGTICAHLGHKNKKESNMQTTMNRVTNLLNTSGKYRSNVTVAD